MPHCLQNNHDCKLCASFEIHYFLVEFFIRVTKIRIDHMTWCEMTESEQEFWNKQLCSERSKLKPQKAVFMSDTHLRKKLKVLCNLKKYSYVWHAFHERYVDHCPADPQDTHQ